MDRVLAGALAFAAAISAGFAQEPHFFGRHAMLQPSYPAEHSDSNTAVALGQRLFFDGRLSRTGNTACASCHQPAHAFAEPRRVSISDNGRQGRRNAPALLNAGLLRALMWDGRFRTLEQQALSPFQRGEMGISVDEAVYRLNSDPEYTYLFRISFGREPTADGLARALAAYQRTLLSGESRVDRFLRTHEPGLLSRLEHDGLDLFAGKAACASCHRIERARSELWTQDVALFTDMRFHNLGVGYRAGRFTDRGRHEVTGLAADVGAFRTPSLRNVAQTAPYMHDGSLATLEAVIDFYDAGGRPNPNLSPRIRPLFLSDYERAALVAFLRALTDRELEQTKRSRLW